MTRVHILALPGETFHLPTRHNQKSHGNRAGKKDNVPGKTSKHAPIGAQSADDPPAKTPDKPKKSGPTSKSPNKASTSKPMTPEQFKKRAEKAAEGNDVYDKLLIKNDMKSVESAIDEGKLKDVSADDVRNAFLTYTDYYYIEINEELRRSNDPSKLQGSNQRAVATLDTVLKASPISGDIIIQRGIKNPAKMFGDAYVRSGEPDANRGLMWEDNAFVSTTAASDVAAGFGSDVIMNILVPKGTFATGTPVSEYPMEREIILMRGLKYRVVSSYQEDPASANSRIIFNVEVIS